MRAVAGLCLLVAGGCQSAAERARDQATRLAASGDVAGAEKLLAGVEDDARLRCLRGELALARAALDEARGFFERAPAGPCSDEGRAAVALLTGRPKDALAALGTAAPASPRARLLRARAHLGLGTSEGAAEARRLLTGAPGAEAAYVRVCAALVLGEPAQAAAEAGKADLEAPTEVWGPYARARIAAFSGAKGAALAALGDAKARWRGPGAFTAVRDDPAFAFLAASEEFQRLTDAGP